jgi:transcriptional regulator with XRE-family HTH domain
MKQSTIYDDDYRKAIDALIAYRKHIGMTQTGLAEKVGMAQYDISKVENYVRRLDIGEMDRWVRAMGIRASVIDYVCDITRPAGPKPS